MSDDRVVHTINRRENEQIRATLGAFKGRTYQRTLQPTSARSNVL
jgi:hypothetical protein